LASSIGKKLDVNDYCVAHLTLILSLHYLVNYSSSILAIYNNEFTLKSTCWLKKFLALPLAVLKKIRDHKIIKICHIFTINRVRFKIVH